VPGYFQYEYARKLGFNRDNICTRLLSPDVASFKSAYNRSSDKKSHSKTLLYIGRLVPHKFESLLAAFTGLSREELNGWKLIVAGKGQMENDPRLKNTSISHLGFLQQQELLAVMEDVSAFCLTASDEPWGTVIQEAAAAGLPLLLSRQCGAHFSFLIPGFNGYLCDGNNIEDVKEKIKTMIAHTPDELLLMGKRSNELAISDTSDTWAATLMSLYQ
jgi:glycosyltransferase involved in cell wall biosynthesis